VVGNVIGVRVEFGASGKADVVLFRNRVRVGVLASNLTGPLWWAVDLYRDGDCGECVTVARAV